MTDAPTTPPAVLAEPAAAAAPGMDMGVAAGPSRPRRLLVATFTATSFLGAFLLFPQRIAAAFAAIVGAIGMLLAAVGVYGVSAYEAVQRRREIGIRLALGGERSLVLRTIMRHAMRLTAAGALLGLLGAMVAGRLLETLLYDLRGLDPWSFGGAAVLVLTTALLASFVPAARAASINPVDALRRE